MSHRPVVFFDIGETLATASFRENRLHLAVYDYIPTLLDQLVEHHGAVLGIISNTHRGDESASERRALSAETLRALEEVRLLQRFHRDLLFLSSESGLRNDTSYPFELAAGRAARVLGVLPQQCVFVGESRAERGRAKDAGMQPVPHPQVTAAVLNGQPLRYLQVDVTDENSILKLAGRSPSLPVLVLHHSPEGGFVLLIGTKEAARALRDSGLSVRVSPTQADPALYDAFLFRDAAPYRFGGPSTACAEIVATPDGYVLGLGSDASVDDYHVDKRHGHTLKLTPNPYLLYAGQERFPAFAKSEGAEVPLAQLAEVVQWVTAERLQRYVDKYSGRNPNAAFVARNRHVRSPAMPAVIDELMADLAAIGQGRLRVSKQRFHFENDLELYNVVAELPGRSDEIVLITAHLDSTAVKTFGSDYDPTVHDAPGADDDASGLAGVICAAQAFCSLFQHENPERTVRFVLFNAEEQGLIGSQHYAHDQRAKEAKIVAVFQMDMIGYNILSPASWEVHAGHSESIMRTQSRLLADTVRTASRQLKRIGAVAVKLPQIFPEQNQEGTWLPDPASGRSDHASFQNRGYPACVISGDFFESHGELAEANPNYHRVTDTHVSFPYAADLTRCVVSAALSYAEPTHPKEDLTRAFAAADASLIPFTGMVRSDKNGTGLSGASVAAYRGSALVGETVTDDAGKFALSTTGGDEALFFIVRDKHNCPLFSTRATPIRPLTDMRITLDIPDADVSAHKDLRATVPLGGLEVPDSVIRSINREAVLDSLRSLVCGEPSESRFAGLAELQSTVLEITGVLPNQETRCQTELVALLSDLAQRLSTGRKAETETEIDEILFNSVGGFAQRIYETDNFSIRYQTDGSAAVDSDTSAQVVLDPGQNPPVVLSTLPEEAVNGTPTYVRRLAFWLERSLDLYTSAPFSMGNPAEHRRIPVVINAASYGSARPSGFMINNQLQPDLLCAVAVHELFHMVQYEYNLSAGPWRDGLMEGGATFAEDCVADRMNRYLDESGSNFNGDGFLVQPNRRMFEKSMRYKTCLFWRYVAEQRSRLTLEPTIGVDTYRRILDRCSVAGCTTTVVSRAIGSLPWNTEFFEYRYDDEAREYLVSSETTIGNYALACYLKQYNPADRRFTFLEASEPIHIDDVVPGAPQTDTLVNVKVQDTESLRSSGVLAFSGIVRALGNVYYEIKVENDVNDVEIVYSTSGTSPGAQCQIVVMDLQGGLKDVIRTDKDRFVKHIPCRMTATDPVGKLVVVITGGRDDCTYQITAAERAAPASDVMVTRWNTDVGREYHFDPRSAAWTWTSPDIQVHSTDIKNEYDLRISVRNKGSAAASSVSVVAEYRPANGVRWLPIADATGEPVVVSPVALAAGEIHTFNLRWRLAEEPAAGALLIRVKVRSPDDLNRDNLIAMTTWTIEG